MKRAVAIGMLLSLLTYGCSFHVKTPIVIDYQKYESIHPGIKKNDIELLLGSPQGEGVHIISGEVYPLTFYYGMAGIATLSTLQCDSGTAFISYKNDDLANIIYFTSRVSDPKIVVNKDLPILNLAENISTGQTKIEVAYEKLGRPDYSGRRFDSRFGITHNIIYYDSSQAQSSGVMREKWILLGYDDNGIIQDLIWVSSFQDDIKLLGKVRPQQLKQLCGLEMIPEYTSLSTDTMIDPVQVEALLKSNPHNIGKVKEILGNPTAIGIKNFKNDPPLFLSNWSYAKLDVKGTERNYIPPTASDDERQQLREGPSYIVMDIKQSRLIISHAEDGTIHEIIWLKPLP